MNTIKETSKSWWVSALRDEPYMMRWLGKQARAEHEAHAKLTSFLSRFGHEATKSQSRVVAKIIEQEKQHGEWLDDLISSRGYGNLVASRTSRYWSEIPDIYSFDHGVAIAAHAEEMRLYRIEAIVEHEETPEDIRQVFTKILKDEKFHARAFRKMASERALLDASMYHEQGMKALGLVV